MHLTLSDPSLSSIYYIGMPGCPPCTIPSGTEEEVRFRSGPQGRATYLAFSKVQGGVAECLCVQHSARNSSRVQ